MHPDLEFDTLLKSRVLLVRFNFYFLGARVFSPAQNRCVICGGGLWLLHGWNNCNIYPPWLTSFDLATYPELRLNGYKHGNYLWREMKVKRAPCEWSLGVLTTRACQVAALENTYALHGLPTAWKHLCSTWTTNLLYNAEIHAHYGGLVV